LVFVIAFVGAAAPAALTRVYDSAIHDLLERSAAEVKDIQVTGRPSATVAQDGSVERTGPTDLKAVVDTQNDLRARLPDDVAAAIGTSSSIVRIVERDTATGAVTYYVSQSPSTVENLRLGSELRSDVAANVRYAEGGPPGPAGSYVLRTKNKQPQTLPRFDVALSAATAHSIGLGTGDIAIISDTDGPVAAVRVDGIFEPVDPGSSYWALDRRPLAVSLQTRDPEAPPDVFATGVIAPEAYDEWRATFGDHIEYLWRFEPDPNKVVASEADAVARGLDEYSSLIAATKASGMQVQLRSGLDSLMRDFGHQLRTAKAVMGVAVAGLLAVALLVLALAAQLLAEHRREALDLVRARGSSLAQLIGLVLAETAVVVVPATVLGYFAAGLAISRLTAASLWLTALVAVGALGLSAALAAYQHRRAGRMERRDLIRIRPSRRRVIVESLIVVLAVIGVVLLHRRGLTTEASGRGVDPFLLAVPVLVGLAAGLLALRVYPYLLGLLSGMAGRWRSAVPFLGVARASRETLTSTLPLVAVLLGLGLGVFGSVVDQGLAQAQQDRAWREVGADAQVRHAGIQPAEIDKIRRLHGVTGVVPAVIEDDAVLTGDQSEPVVAVAIDLAAYRALVAGSPLAPPGGDQNETTSDLSPVLVSPRLEAISANRSTQLDWNTLGITEEVTVDGTIDAFPTLEDAPALTVVPYQSFVTRYQAPQTNTLFLAGAGIDPTDIKAILGSDAFVTTREGRFTEIRDAPLAKGVRTVFAVGVAALGVFCGLAILLALVVGADNRARAIAYLRTLGLSRGQARGLVLLEVGPLVVAAMLGGLVLGMILPHVVGPAVDFRPYTGGEKVSSYPLDPVALGVIFGGLALLAAAAILVDAALSRHRGLGAALRVGD
jgi:putative ABC transport system permease protein